MLLGVQQPPFILFSFHKKWTCFCWNNFLKHFSVSPMDFNGLTPWDESHTHRPFQDNLFSYLWLPLRCLKNNKMKLPSVPRVSWRHLSGNPSSLEKNFVWWNTLTFWPFWRLNKWLYHPVLSFVSRSHCLNSSISHHLQRQRIFKIIRSWSPDV